LALAGIRIDTHCAAGESEEHSLGLQIVQHPPEDFVMRVQDLMTREVHSCRADDSLETAAQLMWDHDCGCIPVCLGDQNGAGKMIGVITDRDICMHALFRGMALRDLYVRDAMAKDVRVCHPGDSFTQAEKTMQEARIRRLPVIDDKGTLVGMICLADLAKLAARERTNSRKDITETEIGDTLATICGAPTWSIAV
jgi:CBS domain-containing protein